MISSWDAERTLAPLKLENFFFYILYNNLFHRFQNIFLKVTPKIVFAHDDLEHGISHSSNVIGSKIIEVRLELLCDSRFFV